MRPSFLRLCHRRGAVAVKEDLNIHIRSFYHYHPFPHRIRFRDHAFDMQENARSLVMIFAFASLSVFMETETKMIDRIKSAFQHVSE